jgi:fructose-bisphosphate aldolase, class II
MKTLREVLKTADSEKHAVGHFNVSELVALRAVATVAREMQLPVIIGVSEGERKFLGVRQSVALVRSFREEFGIDIFLNADHSHSIASAEEAARAGFDMIVFDLSERPFDENASETKKAVEAAKTINPSILVEGEIGFIGAGSEIHETAAPAARVLTTVEDACQFAEYTHIDLLSPAVGTMHGMLPGMLRGEAHKHLDIARIEAIKQATGLFLTLHGGSGTADADFVRAIAAGITVIHLNTELRVAWRRGLDTALAQHPQEVVPYKLLPAVQDQVSAVVRNRLRLFTGSAAAASRTN